MVEVKKQDGTTVTEYEAIEEITRGARLSDYAMQTKLMNCAAVVWQKEGYKDVKKEHWTKFLARLVLKKDYRALPYISDMFADDPAVAGMFADALLSQTRRTLPDYVEMLNNQSEDFIVSCIKHVPTIYQYVYGNRKTDKMEIAADAEKRKKRTEQLPSSAAHFVSGYEAVFEGDNSIEFEALRFLNIDPSLRKKEQLDAIIEMDGFLPDDFLYRLMVPKKNAYIYEKAGLKEKAEKERKNILPFLNKELCDRMADNHPEVCIKMPMFWTEKRALSYLEKAKSENGAKEKMKKALMTMPESLVTEKVLSYFPETDYAMLKRFPTVFAGTERAVKVFNRRPSILLSMPGEYQSENTLIRDGVIFNRHTIGLVKDDELRNCIILALKIRMPEENNAET